MNQKGIPAEHLFRFPTKKFQLPKAIPRILSTAGIRSLLFLADAQVYQSQTNFHKILNIWNNIILELFFCLGLRIGKISALDLPHYGPAERILLIHGRGREGRLLYVSPPDVIEKLHAWSDIRYQLNLTDHATFLNRYGNRPSIYGIEDLLRRHRDLSPINPTSTPRYPGHSFTTQPLNNGASIRDVQELLDHAGIVTAQIYTEISVGRRRQVLEKYNARNFSFKSQIIE